jgi:hypothetical protein
LNIFFSPSADLTQPLGRCLQQSSPCSKDAPETEATCTTACPNDQDRAGVQTGPGDLSSTGKAKNYCTWPPSVILATSTVVYQQALRCCVPYWIGMAGARPLVRTAVRSQTPAAAAWALARSGTCASCAPARSGRAAHAAAQHLGGGARELPDRNAAAAWCVVAFDLRRDAAGQGGRRTQAGVGWETGNLGGYCENDLGAHAILANRSFRAVSSVCLSDRAVPTRWVL